LDNQSDVSVIHPALLTNVTMLEEPFFITGVSPGHSVKITHKGHLRGFFDCYCCDKMSANILCMADVEDKFDITWNKGKSFIVHTAKGNVEFERTNKLYVSEFGGSRCFTCLLEHSPGGKKDIEGNDGSDTTEDDSDNSLSDSDEDNSVSDDEPPVLIEDSDTDDDEPPPLIEDSDTDDDEPPPLIEFSDSEDSDEEDVKPRSVSQGYCGHNHKLAPSPAHAYDSDEDLFGSEEELAPIDTLHKPTQPSRWHIPIVDVSPAFIKATRTPLDRSYISLATNSHKYSKQQIKGADLARDMMERAGYPSAGELQRMARQGNIAGMPITATDVSIADDLYGPVLAQVRGKTTKRKSTSDPSWDAEAKCQQTYQTMISDIMYVKQKPYLVSMSQPLNLTMATKLESELTEVLGRAVTDQINLVKSRGFEVRRLRIEPQASMKALTGRLPGVEVDVTGAGDHLDILDNKIRRIKETIRSVASALPYRLPGSKLNHLVFYCIGRLNFRSTTSRGDHESPYTAFTGRKPRYDKELGLQFGEYCEVYVPSVVSKDALTPRTQPCIALYPTLNTNGSWVFWSLLKNSIVTRSSWTSMQMTTVVIDRVNFLCDNEKDGYHMEILESAEPSEEKDNATKEGGVSPPPMHSSDNDVQLQDGLVPEMHEESDNVAWEVDEVHVSPTPDDETKGQGLAYHMSVKRAVREYGTAAKDAVAAELIQLVRTKKALVPIPNGTRGANRIWSHMFLKAKHDAVGTFVKMKARLVADGSQQDPSLYPDKSAPTAQLQSIMMVLAIGAAEDRHTLLIDITGAYLEADMEGEVVTVHMDAQMAAAAVEAMPELAVFLRKDGTMDHEAVKAIYGCIQSAKLWYNKLVGVLKDMGFAHNEVDPCVMNMYKDGEQITVTIFVDDILATSKLLTNLTWFTDQMNGQFAEVKAELDVRDFSYLGMRVRTTNGVVRLTMDGFVDDLLNDHPHLQACVTPALGDLFNIGDSEVLSRENKEEFHTAVAKLLYYALRVKPDILTAVAYLSTRVRDPNRDDQKKLIRLLGYVKRTREDGITMRVGKAKALACYVDAAFGCHDDGKSHTGICIMMGEACIYARSTKQRIVTRDSTEAEIVAASDKVNELLACNDFMIEQGHQMDTPVLMQDNTSAMTMMQTGTGKDRSKHLRVRKFAMKEHVDEGRITMKHTGTGNMMADALAKPSQGALFKAHTSSISNNSILLEDDASIHGSK
jgi:hypothetical protein